MLNLEIIVISSVSFLCFVFTGGIEKTVEYTVRLDEYLESTSTRVQTSSAIECGTTCGINDSCMATNYNRQTSECELLVQYPNLVRGDVVPKQNWTLYTKSDGCGGLWVAFNQRCYLVLEEKMTWRNANDECLAINADLVDIHSSEENTFVFNYSNSNSIVPIWIGLNDIAITNTFEWSSGKPVTFTAYIPQEPHGGRNKCVCNSVVNDKWDDKVCSRLHAFMCERPIV